MTSDQSLMSQLKRVRSRGLTLVETLVVLAIAVMLIGVLLFYIFPSDDRLCRMEAERLAAYMMGASAEAVMRDGGARVAIDLGKNSATRQVTRQGADITRELWEEDKKAELHQVKIPVTIEAVDTPGLPNLGSGTGYVVFLGRRTEGAVVVLVVEKSIYSVIIPPAGGEIRVERGRGNIPGAQQFERPKIPDLTGYSDKVKKSKGGFPSGGLPPSSPLTRRAPSRSSTGGQPKSAKNVKKVAPPDDQYSPTPSDYNRSEPDYTSPSNFGDVSPSKELSTNENDPTDPGNDDPPKADNKPCQTLADCYAEGPWRICQSGRCVVQPYGRTLMLRALTVEQPTQLASLLETILTDLITQGQLNLMVNLGRPSPWLIQGTRTGEFGGVAKYGQSDQFPTYRSLPNLILGCETGLCQSNFRPDNDDNSLTLYIRDQLVDEDSDDCRYQPLTLIDVNVLSVISVQKSPGVQGQQQAGATITVRGSIRRSAARTFRVKEGESLLDTLEQFDVPENKDTVGDGVPDGWEFVFQGPAMSVIFDDDPTSREEAMPEGCGL